MVPTMAVCTRNRFIFTALLLVYVGICNGYRSHLPVVNNCKRGVRTQLTATTRLPSAAWIGQRGTSTPSPSSTPQARRVIGGGPMVAARPMQGSSSSSASVPRSILMTMNASTKWLITAANTWAILSRLKHYEGPFIVVGAILSSYFTDNLKQVIGQNRPAGSPFTDPGMPSSHSLVSFFLATAWIDLVYHGTVVQQALIGASALSVALLRVVCGYHSFAQIGVGAALGSVMGFSWAKFGLAMHHINPQATFLSSWGCYVVGSIFFISKNMRHWVGAHAKL